MCVIQACPFAASLRRMCPPLTNGSLHAYSPAADMPGRNTNDLPSFYGRDCRDCNRVCAVCGRCECACRRRLLRRQPRHAHVLGATRNKHGTQRRQPDPAQHDPARKCGRQSVRHRGPGLFGGGLFGGLAAGFLGAGLFGLLFGHGFFGGMGGFASLLGLMLQIGLVVIVARLLFAWWQRRHEPAYAAAHPATGHAYRGLGGMFGANAPAGEPLTIGKSDYDAFERLLGDVQAAYSAEDLNALRAKVTPEMLSYFSEQLCRECEPWRHQQGYQREARAGRPGRSLARRRGRLCDSRHAVFACRSDDRTSERTNRRRWRTQRSRRSCGRSCARAAVTGCCRRYSSPDRLAIRRRLRPAPAYCVWRHRLHRSLDARVAPARARRASFRILHRAC